MHPMFLPTLLIDLRAERLRYYIDECHQRIVEIEKTTKIYCTATARRDPTLFQKTGELSTADLNPVTRNLTSVSSELAYTISAARRHASLLAFLKNFQDWYKNDVCAGETATVKFVERTLMSKICGLESFFCSVEHRGTYLTQRAQAQVQTV
jgi:hypothetical protein